MATTRIKTDTINKLAIGARYQGKRPVSWENEDGHRLSFWIGSNPKDVNLELVQYVRVAPRLSIEQGDPEWFQAEEFSTHVAKWKALVKRVWELAKAKNLISAEGFADADAKRVMAAEIYRRSPELYDTVNRIVSADAHGDPNELAREILAARRLRDEITSAGVDAFKTVRDALEKAMRR
mgnify:CR=1 FL=1